MSNGFTQPLDSQGVYMMNPQTGQILDTMSGQTFMDLQEATYFAETEGMQPQKQDALQDIGQMAMPAALAASTMPTTGLFGGVPAAAAAAPAAAASVAAPVAGTSALLPGGASFATSSAPVATSVGGGTILANGTVVPAAAPSIGGAALTGAGIGAGALTGYLQGQGVMDAVQGKRMGTANQAALALPTFGASFLYNPARKLFGSKKHGDQKQRDSVRSQLRNAGFFDKDEKGNQTWNVTMGGNTFEWGDGRRYVPNQGVNIDGKTERRMHDVDWSRADSGSLVGALNPLGYLMGGGSSRSGDFTGYATNTLQGSSANPSDMYQRAGYDWGSARHGIQGLYDQGKIDEGKRDAFFNGLDEVFGQGAYKR